VGENYPSLLWDLFEGVEYEILWELSSKIKAYYSTSI